MSKETEAATVNDKPVESEDSSQEQVHDEQAQQEEPKTEEAVAATEEPEDEEEIVEEKIYTIPLGRAWIYPRPERTPKSVKLIRKFVQRHMKPDSVKIHETLNNFLWNRSIEKPPRRVRVRVSRNKEGVAKVYLLLGERALSTKTS